MSVQGETIAAIATPPGPGGIGIVRLSGAGVASLAARLLGRPPRPRHAHYCAFTDATDAVLDRGLLLHFPAPHSFTGEDVLELQVHGSPVMLRCLLERCIALGARQLEDMRDGLIAVDQLALEAGEANLVGLRLDHLVDRARLQQGRAARG